MNLVAATPTTAMVCQSTDFLDIDWGVVINERTNLLNVASRVVVVFVRREEYHVFLA